MLGTGPFAVPTLQALAASRHEVMLVVTRPPQGRRPTASPLQRAAELLGLQVWSPPTVNDTEAQSRLDIARRRSARRVRLRRNPPPRHARHRTTRRHQPARLAVTQIPRRRPGAMGDPSRRNRNRQQRHPNDPRSRRRPMSRSATHANRPRRRRRPTGISPGVDWAQSLSCESIDLLESGTAMPIAQDKSLASKAPRLKKEDGAIDWSRSAQEIKNQVRALRPWPRAYTYLQRHGRGTTPPEHRRRGHPSSPFGRGQREGAPRHHPRCDKPPHHRNRRQPARNPRTPTRRQTLDVGRRIPPWPTPWCRRQFWSRLAVGIMLIRLFWSNRRYQLFFIPIVLGIELLYRSTFRRDSRTLN